MSKKAGLLEQMKNTVYRIKQFYTAMSIYGGTYITFIAIEFSLYESVLREIENRCEGQSLLSYSVENVKSLRIVHEAIVQTLENLMNGFYAEEVDENNIVQRELFYEPKAEKKAVKEKGIIDEYESYNTNSVKHHTSDILLCGVFSGAVAGFTTNGMETLAVMKQTKRKFSILKYLKKKNNFKKIMFKGAWYRTTYYGMQACLLFFLLEKLKE